MDSLEGVPPKFQLEWLDRHGYTDMFVPPPLDLDSGMRLVGKWGHGPSFEVTGCDSLVFLSLGSEVAIINFARPDSPVVLHEIQLRSRVAQAHLRDTVLYVGDWSKVTLWSVADPRNPYLLGEIPYGVGDFWVGDSLLAFTRQETLRVFNVADPRNPYQTGWLGDTGYVMAGTGDLFIVGHHQQGIYIVDASDPAHPRRRGTYAGGGGMSAAARGNLLCAGIGHYSDQDSITLVTLDISNPDNLHRLGTRPGCGGNDLFLSGSLLHATGDGPLLRRFHIIDISDSTNPVLVGTCQQMGEGEPDNGVWTWPGGGRAFVADHHGGLVVVDITTPQIPRVDSFHLKADVAYDVAVGGSHMYVADYRAGLKVIDVSDPTLPWEVGSWDTFGFWFEPEAVVLRDSFLHSAWYHSNGLFGVYSVSDPSHPTIAGTARILNPPQAIALRDTFAYVGQYAQFDVVSIADPRNPYVLGVWHSSSADIHSVDVEGDVAALAAGTLYLMYVDDPANLWPTGSWTGGGVTAVDIVDTIAYVAGGLGIGSLSIADPSHPYLLDSIRLGWSAGDMVVVDTMAYVSARGIYTVDISDPRALHVRAMWSTHLTGPGWTWAPPYLYIASGAGGVSIVEFLPLGVSDAEMNNEECRGFRVEPTVVRNKVRLHLPRGFGAVSELAVYDCTGRVVRRWCPTELEGRVGSGLELDIGDVPAGVYVIRVDGANGDLSARVVKP